MNETYSRIAELSQLNIRSQPTSKINPAAWVYEKLVERIVDFERELDNDEEIGLRLISTPDTSIMHINDLGYSGPEMLVFHGLDSLGKPMQLIQHYSQMSVLLTAVPKLEDRAVRIGFRLSGQDAQGNEDETDQT